MLKHHLPNDAVFDEKRLFTPADVHGPYTVGPVRIGTPICEDAWHPDVAETLMEMPPDLRWQARASNRMGTPPALGYW